MPTGEQSGSAQAALESARKTAVVDGNLPAAIKQYQAIVDRYAKTDRAAAAEALLRMATCRLRQGDAQAAQGIYAQIVREYGDLSVAAEARTQLAVTTRTASNAQKSGRVLWTPTQRTTIGSVSPDGRYLSFTDWTTGDLAVHDFVTNTDRHLTNKGSWNDSSEGADFNVMSRDGSALAYAWAIRNRYQLRTLRTGRCAAQSAHGQP